MIFKFITIQIESVVLFKRQLKSLFFQNEIESKHTEENNENVGDSHFPG